MTPIEQIRAGLGLNPRLALRSAALTALAIVAADVEAYDKLAAAETQLCPEGIGFPAYVRAMQADLEQQSTVHRQLIDDVFTAKTVIEKLRATLGKQVCGICEWPLGYEGTRTLPDCVRCIDARNVLVESAPSTRAVVVAEVASR